MRPCATDWIYLLCLTAEKQWNKWGGKPYFCRETSSWYKAKSRVGPDKTVRQSLIIPSQIEITAHHVLLHSLRSHLHDQHQLLPLLPRRYTPPKHLPHPPPPITILPLLAFLRPHLSPFRRHPRSFLGICIPAVARRSSIKRRFRTHTAAIASEIR
jgi:hypothetical protein